MYMQKQKKLRENKNRRKHQGGWKAKWCKSRSCRIREATLSVVVQMSWKIRLFRSNQMFHQEVIRQPRVLFCWGFG